MNRIHLFELHDLKWFPALWRDLLTDFLSFFASTFNPYKVIEERLWRAFRKAEADTIIDLCSGAAKPVLTVRDELNKMHRFVPVVISDKFPNRKGFREIEKEYNGRVRPVYDPVDATDVPPELNGFRTIFSAFHHFDWNPAQSIIKDSVVKRQGIGIFEYTDRSLLHYFHNLNAAIFVLLVTPFIKPFSWKRLFFTYVIPVASVLLFIDGLVSCLRTYSTLELQELVRKVESETGTEDYVWEIGQERFMLLMKVTYLIGYPANP